ncbi:low temperature requirement protein A [Intrasporangium sp.]|uniref:low temperature requirement protein A n=1 Tax=Intrasporangium sp. TaxID=1925024 RepID=UPI00336579BF
MSPTNTVPLRRLMGPRDPHEPHRVATPLELFFDLVFVVAIASAAAQWHHGIAEGHAADLVGFLLAFFAIWWAWMNYTWFASAYDCDDVVYRLLTFVIMTGSLMLAAGIPDLFDDGQSGLVVSGYAVMRLAMVGFWLRAAAGDAAGRATALRYAAGIALVQMFWIGRLLVDDRRWLYATFAIGIILELLVPLFAERGHRTPHHPHHITERYALFTIIVLGEVVLAAVLAVQGALESGVTGDLLAVIVGGLLVVYSLWWIYFKRDHLELFEGPLRHNFVAGYGHFAVFASVAATGAALAAAVDVATHEAHASTRLVGLALAGAIAIYLTVLGVLHAVADGRASSATSALVTAGLVVVAALVGPSIGASVLLIGLVLAAAVAQFVWSGRDLVPALDE